MRAVCWRVAALLLCLASAPLCCAAERQLQRPSQAPAQASLTGAEGIEGLGGRTHWLGMLTEAATSPDASVRARAAFLIGQICSSAKQPQRDEGARILRALTKDSDGAVRTHAGIALGHLGVEAAIPACAAALVDGPRWRRYYAVVALERIGTPRARRLLADGAAKQSPYIGEIIEWFLSAPGERPPDAGREAEYTAAQAGQPLPSGTAAEAIFAAAADVLWRVSDGYWHTGRHEDCIRVGLTCTFLDPSHVDAWDGAAWLTWSAGRNAEAIQIYLDGIKANPNRYELYFHLGFHLHNLRRYKAAVPYLQKATEFPCPDTVQRMYAHSLDKSGQPRKSLEVWQRLLEQDPENQVVIRNHARVKRLVESSR